MKHLAKSDRPCRPTNRLTPAALVILALGWGCGHSEEASRRPEAVGGGSGSGRAGSGGRGNAGGSSGAIDPERPGGASGPAGAGGAAGAEGTSSGSAGAAGSAGAGGADAGRADAGSPPSGMFGPGAGEVPPTGPALGAGNPMSTGLDRHDALYCGEWQLTAPQETIFLVKGGKVVWTHAIGDNDELGDCTLTSYGTVFFSRKAYGAQEIKVDLASGKGGEIVWEYRQDGGSEVHAVQPIGSDKVMVMQNSNPPKLMIINKKAAKVCRSGEACMEGLWNPPTPSNNVHGQFRHVRILANGNFLIPYTAGTFEGDAHRVVEYQPGPNQELKEVWEYRFTESGSPWAAVRLRNGNTLISGNAGGWVREVTHDKPAKVVWSVEKNEFPSPMHVLQGAVRLQNGNTIVANWMGPERNRGNWQNLVQYFEITPDKKFVWQLKQWSNPNLGPGSCMQPLDEPGFPENPGEQAR